VKEKTGEIKFSLRPEKLEYWKKELQGVYSHV
jgi:hypothetical protein